MIQILEIPTGRLSVSGCNARCGFGVSDIAGLAESVKAQGVVEPLVVRPVGDGYEVVSGYRRLEAARRAGLETVPCIVREIDDVEATMLSLVENLDRVDLPDIAKARALKRLIDSGRFRSVRELAEKLGKDPAWVTHHLNMLRLESVAESVLTRVNMEKVLSGITERHAREILSHPEDVQRLLLRRVAERVEEGAEPPSIKELHRTAVEEAGKPRYSEEEVREAVRMLVKSIDERLKARESEEARATVEVGGAPRLATRDGGIIGDASKGVGVYLTIPDDLYEKIKGYAEEKDLFIQEAILELIRIGLRQGERGKAKIEVDRDG
jgi:ParB family chromosome partitioning protein